MKPKTRIQREKTGAILEAALDVFSAFGFRGATLDKIAAAAGISKPNLLYYYPSKAAIHRALLSRLLDTWLDPLRAIDPKGEPRTEITDYVRRKLQMARDFPRESRLFANEILHGAPTIQEEITGPLKALVDEKAALLGSWAEAGKIAALDPHHLIFSIWATTQHYADFDVQIRGILGETKGAHFDTAETYLTALFDKALTP